MKNQLKEDIQESQTIVEDNLDLEEECKEYSKLQQIENL